MENQDATPRIYVVDDDEDLAVSVAGLLRRAGWVAVPIDRPEALLPAIAAQPAACVVSDVMMDEMDGFSLARRVREVAPATAMIFMTAWPATRDAVAAVRHFGGLDYLEKPLDEARLLAAVAEAAAWSAERQERHTRLAALSPREREVFGLLVRGLSNKAIAAQLGISAKTVEDHRSQITAKTGAVGLARLIELDPDRQA
ncbi:MAG TPA: response regulator [Novosphingobium sp.]|nr:response regulator [Novosphingobium sp.]